MFRVIGCFVGGDAEGNISTKGTSTSRFFLSFYSAVDDVLGVIVIHSLGGGRAIASLGGGFGTSNKVGIAL